ncbi:MAG: CDGSH iron-sulfur domain-containing protein [Haloferacaceae archaeon]
MDEDRHDYAGERIDVTYDAARCIGVRACVEGLPAVFDADRRPWVDPDAADADADEVARVVERCPTGALSHGGDEAVPDRNAVVVVENGPVHLRGDLDVRTASGEPVTRETRLALCRCGRSGNRPLCDGSHERTFDAAGVDPSAAVDAALSASGGSAEDDAHAPLVVTLRRDGPVHLSGPFTLVRGDDTQSADETALCRCGASPRKPFCDGTHESVGFETAPGE